MPAMTAAPPRLTIELVPQTCWFSNVRKQVSKNDWDRIRSSVYRSAGYRCEVCGGRGRHHPVECHEVWQYEEPAGVQRLLRMIALCPACHEVKHMGLAEIRGRGDAACKHLARVNSWTDAEAARYTENAFLTWQRRSDRTWKLDISALEAFGVDRAALADAARISADERSLTADRTLEGS
jgi:hypothetical protein